MAVPMRCTPVHPTRAPHTHTVILLHGMGSNGQEFRDDFFGTAEARGSEDSQLRTLPERFPHVRWVFPWSLESQERQVGDGVIQQWFDVFNTLHDSAFGEDAAIPGLNLSILALHKLLREEIARLGGHARQLAVLGVSMGCAVGIHAVMSYETRLAGFIGLLGWLPWGGQCFVGSTNLDAAATYRDFYAIQVGLPVEEEEVNRSGPISPLRMPYFIGFNEDDDVVDPNLSFDMVRRLGQLFGLPIQLVSYWGAEPKRHWINEPLCMDDICEFLERVGFRSIPNATQETAGAETAETEAAEPRATEPETAEPETAEPDTAEPDTAEPDTAEPDTAEPETVEPETVEPETVEPETVEPDTAEPDTTELDTAEGETAEEETVGKKSVSQVVQSVKDMAIVSCEPVNSLEDTSAGEDVPSIFGDAPTSKDAS